MEIFLREPLKTCKQVKCNFLFHYFNLKRFYDVQQVFVKIFLGLPMICPFN